MSQSITLISDRIKQLETAIAYLKRSVDDRVKEIKRQESLIKTDQDLINEHKKTINRIRDEIEEIYSKTDLR